MSSLTTVPYLYVATTHIDFNRSESDILSHKPMLEDPEPTWADCLDRGDAIVIASTWHALPTADGTNLRVGYLASQSFLLSS